MDSVEEKCKKMKLEVKTKTEEQVLSRNTNSYQLSNPIQQLYNSYWRFDRNSYVSITVFFYSCLYNIFNYIIYEYDFVVYVLSYVFDRLS